MNKLRWGILSTANINRRLIPPLHAAQRSELVAVASRDAAKAAAYAATWEIPHAFGSYEALLADESIDAVYISLPNTLHVEWAVAAANAGKHVLCEKPIVQTEADLDRLEQAARDNGVHIVEAFANLHHPQQHQLRALVESGRIGALQQINGWFYFFLPPERSNNIRLNATLGGGSLWDVGVYSNALAIFMAGGNAPNTVWGRKTVGASGVDVSFAAQMAFAGGVTAQFHCGFTNPFREGLELIGDEGILEAFNPHNTSGDVDTTLHFTDNRGNQETIVVSAKNSYLAEVEALEACVLDGAAPLLPLSLSRAFLRSVLALHHSAETNTLVHLA